ncbi:MAG: hypothetical protein H7293_01015 [Candidatus Saccharibacteria bacterium]|nr:hypothetical protein [Rhodoferax sp.]
MSAFESSGCAKQRTNSIRLTLLSLWTIAAIGCAPPRVFAQAASAVIEPSTPYALIDWPDPLNPNFAALGNGTFLLNTRSGPKVWRARDRENQLSTARQWPAGRNVSSPWSPFYKGRVLVAGSTPSANFEALMWWSDATQMFNEPLALPEGSVVEALLPLGETNMLACMRTGYRIGPFKAFDKLPTRAVVLNQVDNKIRPVDSTTSELRTAMLAAGVRGLVDVGLEGNSKAAMRLDDSARPNDFPLIFNTANCQWEMRNPPNELKNVKELTIKHHVLPNGRVLVAHATWFDETQRTYVKLSTPYLWNPGDQRWQAIANAAQDSSVDIYKNYGPQDAVVSIGGVHAEFVEFLDPNTFRWTRSAQRLPSSYVPVPAPLDDERTLVFLRERGQVLVVSPLTGPKTGEFSYPHTYRGEVPLAGAGVVLLGGGGVWKPLNRPELLRLAGKSE